MPVEPKPHEHLNVAPKIDSAALSVRIGIDDIRNPYDGASESERARLLNRRKLQTDMHVAHN